jgi:hypothetical protein
VYEYPAPDDGPLASLELCNNPFAPGNEDIMLALRAVQKLTSARDSVSARLRELFPALED